MFIEPVARFTSPFGSKFGIPRQAGLVPELKGRIVFERGFRSADAVRGLEGFDFIWLIWGFSANKPCKPRKPVSKDQQSAFRATVRPPRLGGNERVGVFASRSPFRPNGLGLSSVRIGSIEYESKGPDGKPLGPVINVLGADLMDGTPIYDVKPYITYADSHPEAASGFVDGQVWKPLKVVFDPSVTSADPEAGKGAMVSVPGLTEADAAALRDVLAQDPRPSFHNDPGKVYGMTFDNLDVRFKVNGEVLTVIGIRSL